MIESLLWEQDNPGDFQKDYQHVLLNLLLYTLVKAEKDEARGKSRRKRTGWIR